MVNGKQSKLMKLKKSQRRGSSYNIISDSPIESSPTSNIFDMQLDEFQADLLRIHGEIKEEKEKYLNNKHECQQLMTQYKTEIATINKQLSILDLKKSIANVKKKKELKLEVHSFNEIFKFKDVDEDEFNFKAAAFKDQPFLWGYLKNPFHDQYVIKVDDNETQVYWNDPLKQGELVKTKKNWAEKGPYFSNTGAFMVTHHPKGYALWGQDDLSLIARFKHQHAIDIEWSPEDSYFMTYSQDKKVKCKLWDVRSAKNIKIFEFAKESFIMLPIFKWSPSEDYFARVELGRNGKNKFKIYSTQTFSALKDSYLKMDNVEEGIAWSPKLTKKGHSLLAYWVRDVNSTPAKFCVLNVNTMKEVRFKNMFNVTEATMKWHPEGKFLAILIVREHNDVITSSIEIFRMDEKSIPIESIQYNDKVLDFDFEPNGDQLAVLIEPLDMGGNNDEFMALEKTKYFDLIALDGPTYSIVDTVEKMNVNKISWSPSGRYLVLIHQQNGVFEFWDCDPKNMPRFLTSDKEYGMSGALWDPSGRYFTAIVTQTNSDDKYSIWNVVGKKLYEKSFSRLHQFLWRPRPPVFLSADKLKKVKRTLPSKIKSYKRDEQKRIDLVREKEMAELKSVWEDFVDVENDLIAQHQKESKQRGDLCGYNSDDEQILHYHTERVEELELVEDE
mmetsp:Transcript_5467/g.8074  ORF Transcript_5467/g.8074 Transcript_5467/m.8074 type:complete len:670 (+) Transcript_5467:279-2288(+)